MDQGKANTLAVLPLHPERFFGSVEGGGVLEPA